MRHGCLQDDLRVERRLPGTNFVCVGTTCSSATKLTVKLKNPDISATPQWLTMAIQITNNGTTAVPMADLTVRYWYTYDTTPVVAQASMCDYAQTPPGTAPTSIPAPRQSAVSPAKTNADLYYEIGFAAAAGNSTSERPLSSSCSFTRTTGRTYTQANDYSYNASMMTFATTTKVTVYRLGTLVYGTEPP